MRFEYLVLEVHEIIPSPATDPPLAGLKITGANDAEKLADDFQEILNSYGADGWELISCHPLEWQEEKITKAILVEACRLIFKRPLKK